MGNRREAAGKIDLGKSEIRPEQRRIFALAGAFTAYRETDFQRQRRKAPLPEFACVRELCFGDRTERFDSERSRTHYLATGSLDSLHYRRNALGRSFF